METKNDLIVFNHKEFGSVRTIEIDGVIYFVGKDVANILGYQNGSRDINRHVDEEDRQKTMIFDGNQAKETIVITESGLYSLILSSKLPTAKKFKHWVTSEVLPSLRKYGSYAMQKPDSYMIADEVERAKRWIEEAEERRKLALTVKEQTETIRQQEPFVDFARTVSNSDDCIDMMAMAKLISQKFGVTMGRNKLFKLLRENKILQLNNQPYQKYIDNDTFRVLEYTYKCGDETKLGLKTLVTGKGQIRICNFVKKYVASFFTD